MENIDLSEIKNILSILDQPRKYDRRVIFIRHGESEGNVRNIIYGSTDYSLTQRGEYQAKLLGTVFQPILSKFQTIRSSNLTRSLQTCDNIVDLSNPMITTNFTVMGLGVLNNKWGILNEQEPIKTGSAFKISNEFKRLSPLINPSNETVSEDMKNNCFEKYKIKFEKNSEKR
jgi:bisphosphoglycerate-dependent phosphoglycerate mutase